MGKFTMGIVGSSFYDSINKVLTGFILILPMLLICNCKINSLPISPAIAALLILVVSWIMGLILWVIQQWIKDLQENQFKEKYVNQINKSYTSVISEHNISVLSGLPRLTLTDYYRVYYEVQKKNLLGNIPTLEALSAFFLNLIYISYIWMVVFEGVWVWGSPLQVGIYIHSTGLNKDFSFDFLVSMGTRYLLSWYLIHKVIIVILISIVFFCWVARKRTEEKIQKSIFEVYYLSK